MRLAKLSGFSLPFSNPVRSCGASQRQRENHLSLRPSRLAVNTGFSKFSIDNHRPPKSGQGRIAITPTSQSLNHPRPKSGQGGISAVLQQSSIFNIQFSIPSPSPRNTCTAKYTTGILYVKRLYQVSIPLNHNFLTVMAISLGSLMPWHIPQIDVPNTRLKGYLSQPFKCSDRRGRNPCQLVLWEKPQKVERIVRPQLL